MKSTIFKYRKLLFSLTALVLFFVILTITLEILEQRKIIDTQSSDDRVNYLDRDWLEKIKNNNGWEYQIHDRHMIQSSFILPKKEGTFRIFVSGGSFAMGSPYVVQYENDSLVGGFPDWILAELELRFPDTKFELINAATGGQNSNRVRQIVDRLAKTQPDLMIVATGNNEGYVPATRLNESLHQWAIYRLLKKSIKPAVALHQRELYAPQDHDSKEIEKQYRDNILSMIKACKMSNVPLILCTLPINLKFKGPDPQVHGKYSDKSDDEWIGTGMVLLDEKDDIAAFEAFSKSKNVGMASFYLAQILERKKNYEQAKQLYQLHVQHIPKNRIRPSYNDFLRQVAKQSGVLLADLDKVLQSVSPTGIISPHLFTDYCHLTLNGYYLCGQEILRLVLQDNLIPESLGKPLPPLNPAEIIAKKNWEEKYFSKMKNQFPVWEENLDKLLQSDNTPE